MFFVLSQAWDKEKIMTSHEELNLRFSNSVLQCSTTKPQRLYDERGPLQSSYIGSASMRFFFSPHSVLLIPNVSVPPCRPTLRVEGETAGVPTDVSGGVIFIVVCHVSAS